MTNASWWVRGFATLLLAIMAEASAEDRSPRTGSPPLTSEELAHWIDEQFETEWHASQIPVPAVADDATFLKRVHLDLTGTIPSVSAARDFLTDTYEYKRAARIERLLSDERRPDRYAERTAAHWAMLWRRMIVPGNTPQARQAAGLEPWLKAQFLANEPYDSVARKIVTANSNGESTPAASRRGVAAFFSGVREGVVGDVADAKIRVPGGDAEIVPTFLGGQVAEPARGKTYREALADWMVAPDNPQFAATAVNRVWMYLMGRGMTDSVDDLDRATPEERRILDRLARLFVQSGYDLRWLIAGICKSNAYQRECVEIDGPSAAAPVGARLVKALMPEQVFGSLEQALALPVAKIDGSARVNGLREQLLARLNEAHSNSPDEFRAGIPQALLMMNGQLTREATDLESSRTLRGVLEAPFLDESDKLATLYLAAFTRPPSDEEREFLLGRIADQNDVAARQQVYSEVFWALLNSPEFVLER